PPALPSCPHLPPTCSSPLSLHDALPISPAAAAEAAGLRQRRALPHERRRRAALSLRLRGRDHRAADVEALERHLGHRPLEARGPDRKSTRLNSSHRTISYAVFCLKKKTI